MLHFLLLFTLPMRDRFEDWDWPGILALMGAPNVWEDPLATHGPQASGLSSNWPMRIHPNPRSRPKKLSVSKITK
jgi:hypothetical protein